MGRNVDSCLFPSLSPVSLTRYDIMGGIIIVFAGPALCLVSVKMTRHHKHIKMSQYLSSLLSLQGKC